MSVPVEYDFALLKFSDMEVVPAFTTLCGLTNIQVNEVAETATRRVRDCATPNKPGNTKVKVLGTSWTVSGTGLTNSGQRATIKTELLAKKVNYRVEYYADDGTDAGDLLGTDAGLAIMTTNNMSLDTEGESSLEITLEGEGALTYTAV